MINIRPFQAADETLLADLYEATVRRWAPALYSRAQVNAWAMVARDTDRFHSMLTAGRTFVAVGVSNQPVGFSGVEDDGRIASLYVAADATRSGIGTALLSHVRDHASQMKSLHFGLKQVFSAAHFLSDTVSSPQRPSILCLTELNSSDGLCASISTIQINYTSTCCYEHLLYFGIQPSDSIQSSYQADIER